MQHSTPPTFPPKHKASKQTPSSTHSCVVWVVVCGKCLRRWRGSSVRRVGGDGYGRSCIHSNHEPHRHSQKSAHTVSLPPNIHVPQMPSTLQSPSSDPTSCQGHGTHHHSHHIATPRCRTSPSFTPHFHNHEISAVPTNPRPRPPLTHHHSIHDRRTRSFRSPKLFLLLLLQVLDFVNPSNEGRTHARTSINPPGMNPNYVLDHRRSDTI